MTSSYSQAGYNQGGYAAEPLLASILTLQDLARVENSTMVMEKWQDDRARTDVTARWKGYSKNGNGLAEYQGRVYEGRVISNKVKQKNGLVNLRRTKLMNFIDWQ